MAGTSIHILVVEDDATQRAALGESLKRLGYKATLTASPEEAINLVKIKTFQGAILDCLLPKQNGVELAKALRKGRFGSGVLILTSGIFRDRTFRAEAMEKTQAKGFLEKPIDIGQLKGLLDENFKDLIQEKKVPLQVLVSMPFSSARERIKVIEGLENIRGYDLPFVISVLMDAASSGFLNIVDVQGQVSGIYFNSGLITRVDTSQSRDRLREILVQKGFVTPEELVAYKDRSSDDDLISALIDSQLLSPHILPELRREILMVDLRRFFVDGEVQINFAPERIRKKEPGWSLEDITPLLHDVALTSATLKYLEDFYKDWLEFPLKVGATFKADHPLFAMPIFERTPRLNELLSQNLTVAEICQKGNFSRENFFRSLHLLVMRRLVIFDEVKRVGNAKEHLDRVKGMLKELQGRNPFQVFSYFGLEADPGKEDVSRIYKEFARSNHPDHLPPATPADLREAVNQLFQIVSASHDALVNDEKRAKLVESLRQKEAELQIRAEHLAEEAIQHLSRGQSKEALLKSEQAVKLFDGRLVKIAHAWALLKTGSDPKAAANEASRLLEAIPSAERRNDAKYQFVAGLMKRALGDTEGALQSLDKAIALDPEFLDARRERSATAGRKKEKTDIFNADISQIVHNFFKKK